MNYKKIHDQIIKRGQDRILEGYGEKHHVIPKSMGGSNDKSNLVKLTAQEHFIIHKLLSEIYPNNSKLHYAVRMMATMKNSNGRNYKVGSREYQRLKENIINLVSVQFTGTSQTEEHIKKRMQSRNEYYKTHDHPLLGKHHSDETRKKISESHIGIVPWNIGMITNQETRDKISESNKGKVLTTEHREHISKSKSNPSIELRNKCGTLIKLYYKTHDHPNKGITLSDATKKKMSISIKCQAKYKCPHCNVIGIRGNMNRWHFDNCKFKK